MIFACGPSAHLPGRICENPNFSMRVAHPHGKIGFPRAGAYVVRTRKKIWKKESKNHTHRPPDPRGGWLPPPPPPAISKLLSPPPPLCSYRHRPLGGGRPPPSDLRRGRPSRHSPTTAHPNPAAFDSCRATLDPLPPARPLTTATKSAQIWAGEGRRCRHRP